jgi:hypothetical protein
MCFTKTPITQINHDSGLVFKEIPEGITLVTDKGQQLTTKGPFVALIPKEPGPNFNALLLTEIGIDIPVMLPAA